MDGKCPDCGKPLEHGQGRSLATLGFLVPMSRCTGLCGYVRIHWDEWLAGIWSRLRR
jgi:hypothetical protein